MKNEEVPTILKTEVRVGKAVGPRDSGNETLKTLAEVIAKAESLK